MSDTERALPPELAAACRRVVHAWLNGSPEHQAAVRAYMAELLFGTTTPGDPPETEPPVDPDPPGETDPPVEGGADAISRSGITWRFRVEERVGRYVTGDPCVAGPVLVEDIEPGVAQVQTTHGTRTMNGSQVNPSLATAPASLPGRTVGYDSHFYGRGASMNPRPGYAKGKDYSEAGRYYDDRLNVGLRVPDLALVAGDSLVSTVSSPIHGDRPTLHNAAVLTVVDELPPDGTFRPPYCAGDKVHRWSVGQLRLELLRNLPRPPGSPAIADLVAATRGPWLRHACEWPQRYHAPADLMPDYSADFTELFGAGTLALHLEYPIEDKLELAANLVQIGIDFWGLARQALEINAAGLWQRPNGGQHNGVKWMILHAALLLDDDDMLATVRDERFDWAEDGQTFIDATGAPNWGVRHSWRPSQDDPWGVNPYQYCCTASSWWGQALAAMLLGARQAWGHEPFFLYLDRYRDELRARGITSAPSLIRGGRFGRFCLNAWDTIRPTL